MFNIPSPCLILSTTDVSSKDSFFHFPRSCFLVIFQAYLLAESRTGYVITGHLKHKSEKLKYADRGDAYARVWDLCERGGILDQGYHIYMDNYFTSYRLLRDLYDRNTYGCGTLKGTMSQGCQDVIRDRNSPYARSLIRGQELDSKSIPPVTLQHINSLAHGEGMG